MRKLLTASLLAFVGLGGSAIAADKPMVVVELYTSQGCSSCPPADKILTELSKHDDVIALGLHVDYWDYLGWKDKFAVAAFSDRQQTYNAILPSRYRLVTPQMIVHGLGQVAGGSGKSKARIDMLIKEARATKDRADLRLQRTGSTLVIQLSSKDGELGSSTVQLVRFLPQEEVAIRSGENRGRNIKYTNIVSDWKTIGKWDGYSPLTMKYKIQGDAALAVVVQSRKQGPVLAARQLR